MYGEVTYVRQSHYNDGRSPSHELQMQVGTTSKTLLIDIALLRNSPIAQLRSRCLRANALSGHSKQRERCLSTGFPMIENHITTGRLQAAWLIRVVSVRGSAPSVSEQGNTPRSALLSPYPTRPPSPLSKVKTSASSHQRYARNTS